MDITVEHRKRREKNTVVYSIDFISNYCHMEYNKLNARIIELLTLEQQKQKLAEDYGVKLANNGDLTEIKEKLKEFTEIANNGRDVLEWQWEIFEEILESNDYDFNRDYWEKTTPQDGVSSFLKQCFGLNEKVKKKLEELGLKLK